MLNWVIMRVINGGKTMANRMTDMTFRTLCTAVFLGVGLLLNGQAWQEELLLLTDRGHYITGENINYRAFYRGPAGTGAMEWSKVIYVELIQPNGSTLVQGKVKNDSTGAIGSLSIPEDLPSGTYYLKAYTRWMRNYGPEGFVYTSLKIYDPYNEQVLPVDSSSWSKISAGCLPGKVQTLTSDILEVRMEKVNYRSREEVEALLIWKSPQVHADLAIGVARVGLQGGQTCFQAETFSGTPGKHEYLPESQGLSLTGRAVSLPDSIPAPYATIYVSVLGEERDFFCNYSDSVGRFYFSFPGYAGERDFFVSTLHAEFPDLELLIDHDFSQDVLQLPSFPIHLNDSLNSLITEMSVNAQISRQYYPAEVVSREVDTSAGGLLFYGSPVSTIYFDDYIRLPKLEEYFLEVIPQVAVRKSHGRTRLVLQGEHPDLEIHPPLLMIDGVAIFDVEAVLAVSPRLIERIEIVNEPYVRGNVSFGGIISLISKNNDLGYIDLPSSGLLVNYRMLDPEKKYNIETGLLDARLPDVRNTLYWNPGLKLNQEHPKKISFLSSDLKGAYEILIRGRDSAGEFVELKVPFQVE
jgi:hypothetical protein